MNILRQVQIIKSLGRLRNIFPSNREQGNQLLRKTNSRTRVCRKINPWNSKSTSKFRHLEEIFILGRSKRTDLMSDVVGDNNESTTLGIFGSFGGNQPSDHTSGIGARFTFNFNQLTEFIENELLGLQNILWHP